MTTRRILPQNVITAVSWSIWILVQIPSPIRIVLHDSEGAGAAGAAFFLHNYLAGR